MSLSRASTRGSYSRIEGVTRGMSVRRVDDTAQPGSFSCAQKIVQTGDNSNNN